MKTSQKWRGRIIRFAPLFLWIGVIFYLSGDHGAMSSTSRFIGPLLHFLFPAAPEETIQIYHGYIRKAAHFGAYAVLALLATRAFLTSPGSALRSYWPWFAIGLVLLIAALDELNQSSSLVRTGSIFDVMLDVFGGLCAIGFVYLVRYVAEARA